MVSVDANVLLEEPPRCARDDTGKCTPREDRGRCSGNNEDVVLEALNTENVLLET